MTRVRLDEEILRGLLAWGEPLWKGEVVEVTTHQEDSVTTKLCKMCGVEKPADSGYYASNPTYCKPCTVSKINAHIHDVNEATRATAENHRQPWSELEIETLLAGVAEGMSGKDLAEMLGRTYLSVHGKIQAIRKLLAEGKSYEVATYTIRAEVTITRDKVCPICNVVRPCFCD